jgi:protein-S-isoprenylcysteine O-methyltransferase Ste14
MVYLQWIPTVVIIGAALLVSSGRLDLWPIWEYVGLFAVGSFVSGFFIDPGLVKERWKPGGKRLPLSLMFMALAFVAHLCLAGLDIGRYHWSDTVPRELQLGALATLTLAFAAIAWAMHVNPFFSSVVRIQADRGQKLIREGPYRWVRHPGYAAGLILCLSSGLALGSWITGLSGYAFVPFLIVRAMREDALLRRELSGYQEYMQDVRYRLAPGIW